MATSPASVTAARSHVFPPGTPCLFCGAPAAPGCNDTTEMWRLKDPHNYSKVKSYDTFDLPLPRCARCQSIHARGKKWSSVVWTVGAVLCIPAIGLASGNWIMAVMLGLLLPLIPAGFVIVALSKAPGVRSNTDGTLIMSYPPVAAYLAQGWGITNGYANANRERHPDWNRK